MAIQAARPSCGAGMLVVRGCAIDRVVMTEVGSICVA